MLIKLFMYLLAFAFLVIISILILLMFFTKPYCQHEYEEATYFKNNKPIYICKLCGKIKRRKLH